MRGFALLLLVTACRITGSFECGLDEVCRQGERFGVCEVEGYCSFGDPACPSGRRYADNAGDGLADRCVADSAEPLTCRERWMTDVVRFGAVSDLGVSSAMDERDPWMAAAGNELVFSSNRTGSASYDIYIATRADTTVPWGTPSRVPALSSEQADSRVTFSADGLTVYLTSDRQGTKGGSDVWRATRTTPTGTFATPDQATVASVNSAGDEHDAYLSNDGLSLYIARGTPPTLAVATRASSADSFDAPAVIAELDTGGGDADVAITDDELLMVFSSQRAAPVTGSNLWYTTRPSVTEKWRSPRLVPDVSIDGDEGDAFLSADACTLAFSRTSEGTALRDVVYAVVTP